MVFNATFNNISVISIVAVIYNRKINMIFMKIMPVTNPSRTC